VLSGPYLYGANLNYGDENMAKDTFEELFATDEKKATNGVPIPMGYNANEEEITFFIAEINNPKHTAAQRQYSKLLEASRRNEKRYEAVLAKVVAKGILLKWEGVLDEDGNEVESNLKNREKYLVKYPKLFQAVMDQSMNQDNFRPDSEDAEKDTEKN
jgi:hypothetical protein